MRGEWGGGRCERGVMSEGDKRRAVSVNALDATFLTTATATATATVIATATASVTATAPATATATATATIAIGQHKS